LFSDRRIEILTVLSRIVAQIDDTKRPVAEENFPLLLFDGNCITVKNTF